MGLGQAVMTLGDANALARLDLVMLILSAIIIIDVLWDVLIKKRR